MDKNWSKDICYTRGNMDCLAHPGGTFIIEIGHCDKIAPERIQEMARQAQEWFTENADKFEPI